MKAMTRSLPGLTALLVLLLPAPLEAAVAHDAAIPQLAFAAQELRQALNEAGRDDLQVVLTVKPDTASPEAFEIRLAGPNKVEVTGSDATGAMYGGLEVADRLRLDLPVRARKARPFVRKRGIKFNIPWDARTPSYDDTGDAAQKNIETIWDFEFWRAYLDDLARYRYNVLSLWSTHPYPNLVRLEDYPDTVLEDVYRVDAALQPHFRNRLQDLDQNGDGHLTLENDAKVLKLVRKMTIDEKIAHWKRVFKHAEDRGIEIHLFSWNVFTFGATGKHGITQDQTNPVTIDYLRKSVCQALLTYPQIAGIGVCSGENDRRELDGTPDSTEHYIFKTFGRGIMDARKAQPGRVVRFIHRRHGSEPHWVREAFKDYTGGIVNASVKYAVAHMYSSRRPQEWERRIIEDGWSKHFKIFLNLRNDDIFMHRWGSPDYVRQFIRRMPHEQSPGFYMGSDGYVWGREFISKHPGVAGQLEIVKHWYRFRLWGQLAYDNELGDDYWRTVLKHRFPRVDAGLLHDTWQTVSEIIPRLNRSVWAPTDADFAPEGCMQREGFLTVEDYHFARKPMILNRIDDPAEPMCLSVTEWARAVLSGKGDGLKGITPLQVAENLDGDARAAEDALPALRRQAGDDVELHETLLDIESMAYLGRYYADKMRGAAKLALFREGGRRDRGKHGEAVAHLVEAADHWKAYAKVLDSHYLTSLTARTHFLDWNATLKHVLEEVETVRKDGDFPEVRIAGLKDGDRFPVGTDLRVKVEATDTDGIQSVKLYFNGLLLEAESAKDPPAWSASSDKELKGLKEGFYRLEAVAVDANGVSGRQVIHVQVGNPSPTSREDWRDEPYRVFLREGDVLKSDKDDEIRIDLPRLECKLLFKDDGKMVLRDEAADAIIWKANSKGESGRHHATFKNGSLTTYTRWPADRDANRIWKSKKPKPRYKGPFAFGITRGKKIACFTEENGRTEIVWYYTPAVR